MLQTNSQIELASEFIQNTGANLFLTGKAGTGKTTFLHTIAKSINKRMIIAAPTGVAAINARGVTLHSLFQIPFGANIPLAKQQIDAQQSNRFSTRKLNKNKLALIRSIEILVIDEISMVRCDLLDTIDEILREVRRNSKPFGGVQLLMIGDIHQLSPICSDDEWQVLRQHYTSPYFFNSKALTKCSYITVELKTIFRQSDTKFTNLLNAVRENRLTPKDIELLNSRYNPNFNPSDSEGYITLTTHNHTAANINGSNLKQLQYSTYRYTANIEGEYPEYIYPTDTTIELKQDAQVIFIKNDISPNKLYYNGLIGKIVDITDSAVTVRPNGGGEDIKVSSVSWENIEFTVNKDGGIEERVKGTFSQIPLKCAWAITIHKSQGLTFDKVQIDARNSFAHGQVYVALSRCRTLEGLVLKSPIESKSIKHDSNVDGFKEYIDNNEPTTNDLELLKKSYFADTLCDIFSYKRAYYALENISNILKRSLYTQYPTLCDNLRLNLETYNRELVAVGESFKQQIVSLVNASKEYKTDCYIKERLEKASNYFAEKQAPIDSTIAELSDITIDAKEVKKRIVKLLEELNEELAIKRMALNLICNNFTCEEYLKQKFKIITDSAIKQPKKGKSQTPAAKVSTDIINKGLYNSIIAWRSKMASDMGVPLYVVITNRSIIEIQATLPTTPEKLKSISGIGAVKINSYGADIINMVIEYIEQNNISINDYYQAQIGFVKEESTKEIQKESTKESVKEAKKENAKARSKKEPKKREVEPKIETHKITLSLYREGMIINDIATSRNLSPTTISTHIAKCIKEGELPISDFLDSKKIEYIKNYLLNNKLQPLKEVKEALGEDVSYSDIKYVLAIL